MLSRFHRNDKGFTLIELLVVILIIGILVAIAVPIFQASKRTAQRRACQANLRTLDGAVETFNADWDVYPTSLLQLKDYVNSNVHYSYIKEVPTCPTNAKGYDYNQSTHVIKCLNNNTTVNGYLVKGHEYP